MKITKKIASKVLSVIDEGLSCGVGEPVPGKMCVEAAVCFALGEKHGDEPSCVGPVLRSLKVALNDLIKATNKQRARMLRRIGIAQLGTKDNFDSKEFLSRLNVLIATKVVPDALKAAAKLQDPKHKKELLDIAKDLKKDGSYDNLIKAKNAANAANAAASAAANAAYAASAAANAAYAASAANAAAYAAYAASAAANAAYAASAAAYAAAASAAKDPNRKLSEYIEDIVQILIEMKTPGSKFLYLTEE